MGRIQFYIVLILFLASCEDLQQKGAPVLPESKGRPGELVLVTQPHLRQTTLNVQIDSLLRAYQPNLGQPEEYYRVIELSPEDLTNYTRLNGLQIFLETDDTADALPNDFWHAVNDTVKVIYRDDSLTIKYLRDVWARPQHVLHLKGNNVNSLAAFLSANREFLLNQILGMEYEMIGRRYAGYRKDSLSKRILETTGVNLCIPVHYRIATLMDSAQTKGFAWIRNETPHISQGVLIYYRPYTDSLSFQTGNMVQYRDSITKRHVPGAAPNSYMSTFTEWPLTERIVTFKGMYAKELYGLWNTQNDFMGGPFYSLTYYDQKRKRLVTAEGFVHAPKYNKTQYLRELIGIVGTIAP